MPKSFFEIFCKKFGNVVLSLYICTLTSTVEHHMALS